MSDMTVAGSRVRPVRRWLDRPRGVGLVVARELEAYFDSPIASIVGAGFLLLSCTMFMNSFFLDGVIDMSAYFRLLPFLLIPFIAAVTMRSWAEERAQNTFEFVMTLPLEPWQIVLGKYGAAIGFYCVVLLGSLPIVIMLEWLGEPDLSLILAGYLGALLLGALLVAAGLFASGLTRDQIVAFVMAALIACLLVLSGHDRVVEVLDGLVPALQLGSWIEASISALPRYETFGRGILSVADLLYFLLLSAFFLWMNQLSLARLRR